MKFDKPLYYLLKSQLGGISIMDRYIVTELIGPFLLSIGIFSSLGVAIGYSSDLINKVIESNLPIVQAAQVLLLKVPEFISYALPISVLLSSLMAFGRLSNNSEIIALRGCGVSLYRIVAPAIALSLLVTGITFLFNELVVPAANYRATAILVESIQEEHPFWQTRDIFYPDYEKVTLPNGETRQRLKSLFYAKQFDGKQMKMLTILQWLGENLNQIIISDSASWNGEQQTWDFFNGTIYKIASDTSYDETLSFDRRQIPFSRVPFDLAVLGRDPDEMNIAQAQAYMKLLRQTGDEKKLLMFEVRTQQKMAFPFVCLVFGVVGSALGSRPQHVSRATSFGLSVAIVFLYYVLGFSLGSFGTIGIFSPFLAAWLPNFIGLGVGLWLLGRTDSD
ncbi:putative permease [Pleurocapsa sp. PCC 7327]|uniref:LptF/LptG family permease n=1 Tax=Pleurocapsa sp. PCC 7327 TaxID=118163 RepID=UPI00029FEB6B|nr:LptF/LptG family permease [Pleurocapsa sp. PCC 7327]AFY77328.1 putative permease [Pleurocapsa sp. PCC 7327]